MSTPTLTADQINKIKLALSGKSASKAVKTPKTVNHASAKSRAVATVKSQGSTTLTTSVEPPVINFPANYVLNPLAPRFTTEQLAFLEQCKNMTKEECEEHCANMQAFTDAYLAGL